MVVRRLSMPSPESPWAMAGFSLPSGECVNVHATHMTDNIAIGIDLGTSYSCVALVQDGIPTVLPNEWGERTHASVVSFLEDGSVLVGNPAKKNIITNAENTVYSAKRLIGRYFFSDEVKKAQDGDALPNSRGREQLGAHRRCRDKVYSLPEISALVLKEMKAIAETTLGQPVTKAVITVPAYFNDNQRQATKDAGRIAGLDVLRILNEPTAAALAYGFGRDVNQRVVIYDLGGGTFDVSILEIGRDVFEVLSTAGDTYLGGDDFDDRIMTWLAEDFLAKTRLDLRAEPLLPADAQGGGGAGEDRRRPARQGRDQCARPFARTPTGKVLDLTRDADHRALQPDGDGPRPAHLQSLRRGAAERAPHRGGRRRRDPGRWPDAAAHHPQLGAALLSERTRWKASTRTRWWRWGRRSKAQRCSTRRAPPSWWT